MNTSQELAHMETVYMQMVQSLQDGVITLEEAQANVSALSAVDSSGAWWGMNINGDFIRAHVSGGEPVTADPSLWISSPSSAAAPAQQPGFPQGGSPFGNAPGAPAQQPGFPQGGSPFGNSPGAPGGYSEGGNDLFNNPMQGFNSFPGDAGGYDFEEAKPLPDMNDPQGKPRKEKRSLPGGSGLSGAIAWVNEHKKVAILGAFGIALVGFAALQLTSGGEEEPGQLLPGIGAPAESGTNESQGETDPTVDLTPGEGNAFPTDDGNSDGGGFVTDQVSSQPSPEEINAALSAVATGGSNAAAVIAKVDPLEVARASVILTGAQNSENVRFDTTELQPGKKGNFTQGFLITDESSGQTILKANVTWTLSENTWKLVRAPAFS
jgi:hypothetical protein